MKQSSVSPDLCETIVPQPLLLASWCALMLSVTVPIWLTLSSRQLQAFLSTAVWMRVGLVTVKSSPTIWIGVAAVTNPTRIQTGAGGVSDGQVISH